MVEIECQGRLGAAKIARFVEAGLSEKMRLAGGVLYFDGDQAQADQILTGVLETEVDDPATSQLKHYLADKRWQVQNAGCLWQGQKCPTDRDARASVGEAIQSIDNGILSDPTGWKLPDGFTSLTRVQLIDLAKAMAAHVQGCFATEAALLARIDAGQVTREADIDAASWPGQ